MDKSTTTDSTKFSPGYGDFALLCSDGVICHFPRYLLGHMSGLFKDMFDLPNSSAQSASPLALTEPSGTIELLLQHIDPKTPVPDIDTSNIIDLLEVAQKYQVPTINAWFENEIQLKKELRHRAMQSNRPVVNPLLQVNPLLVLYCALRFNLPTSGRLALAEFARCKSSLLASTNYPVPIHAYLHGARLREERVVHFRGIVAQLTRRQMVGTHSEEIYGAFDFFTIPDARKTCSDCADRRAIWAFEVESTILKEPNWASFLASYEKNTGACTSCKTGSWNEYYRSLLAWWETKTRALEINLPEWLF